VEGMENIFTKYRISRRGGKEGKEVISITNWRGVEQVATGKYYFTHKKNMP